MHRHAFAFLVYGGREIAPLGYRDSLMGLSVTTPTNCEASPATPVPSVPLQDISATAYTPRPLGESVLLSVPAAAAFLGISVWQVRGLIAAGDLRVVKVGRKFYLRRKTLLRWAEVAEERA